MNAATQRGRWDEDTSDLRHLARLIRRRPGGAPADGNVQPHVLLARVAFRGMVEQGKSEEEIADAFGLATECVRHLVRSGAAEAATADGG